MFLFYFALLFCERQFLVLSKILREIVLNAMGGETVIILILDAVYRFVVRRYR